MVLVGSPWGCKAKARWARPAETRYGFDVMARFGGEGAILPLGSPLIVAPSMRSGRRSIEEIGQLWSRRQRSATGWIPVVGRYPRQRQGCADSGRSRGRDGTAAVVPDEPFLGLASGSLVWRESERSAKVKRRWPPVIDSSRASKLGRRRLGPTAPARPDPTIGVPARRRVRTIGAYRIHQRPADDQRPDRGWRRSA
jgi:hypothetical protein